MELAPEVKKRLRAEHPLYTRLSGDVVWALLEEAGLDPEHCEVMMDEVLAAMNQTLKAMAAVEQGSALALRLQLDEDACPHAAALNGAVINPANGDWKKALPPYAVGCSALGIAADVPGQDAGQDLPPRPACGLICPLLEGE